MDTGGVYDFEAIRRFNGSLFASAHGLPLTTAELDDLAAAAALDWALVEPAIFGTLLERALDPAERRRLGAHYTPRAFVEQLVRATIDEPLQAEWEAVRIRADELLGDTPTDTARTAARKVLESFKDRLADLRVLDPACGTGNFLYVAYALVKSLEHEVFEALRELGGTQQSLSLAGHTVTPSHFLGLEVKPWAAEIAQLVLTLGHLQWELLQRGQSAVADPVLSAERSLACRDALVSWAGAGGGCGANGAPSCFVAIRGAPGTDGERCAFGRRSLTEPDGLVPSHPPGGRATLRQWPRNLPKSLQFEQAPKGRRGGAVPGLRPAPLFASRARACRRVPGPAFRGSPQALGFASSLDADITGRAASIAVFTPSQGGML